METTILNVRSWSISRVDIMQSIRVTVLRLFLKHIDAGDIACASGKVASYYTYCCKKF